MPSRFDERYPDDWRQRREQVFERDEYTCRNCDADVGEDSDTVGHCHHIVPISCDGTHKLENLSTLCEICHAKAHSELRSYAADNDYTDKQVFAGTYLPEVVEHDDTTDQETVAWEGAEDDRMKKQAPTKWYWEFSLPYRLKWWTFGIPDERQASGYLLYKTIPDE